MLLISNFMKKKSFIFSDLTKKQLQVLKELYVQKKLDSMSNDELKKFVFEIITHKIMDTIGKEEEMEAWKEMSEFFEEQFEIIIIEIQEKFKEDNSLNNFEENPEKERLALIERNISGNDKTDMWDD